MECPNCNSKMEKGFLQGHKRVAWVKNKHKVSLRPKEGEVLLANNMVNDFIFPAWICKTCEKIIIDYSDKDVQMPLVY